MRSTVEASPWRFVPALQALRGYSWRDARHDLVAGLTVSTVAVPQAMAYALAAGLPAEHGLYGAVVMAAVGGFFASSRHVVHGPSNATSIALLSALAGVGAEHRVHAAVVLAALVGAMQLAVGVLRVGDLVRYVSHSVIVGFTLGAAALLGLGQVANFLGLQPRGSGEDPFLVRVGQTLVHGGPVHGPTVAVGVATVGVVLALGAVARRPGWRLLPDLLIAVVGAAAVTAALHLDQRGVAVVGHVPRTLPRFSVPSVGLAEARDLAPGALSIGLIGLLEAVSIGKVMAARSGQRLVVSQQCVAEGLANLAGSLFLCFPGAGSLSRSAINHRAGARTQWAAIASAAAVAVVVAAFAPWARYVPRSALAGILLVAAVRLVDGRALRYHLRASRFDAGLVLATAAAAVGVSIEFCIGFGALLSCLLTVPRAGRMRLTELVLDRSGLRDRTEADDPDPRVLLFGLEGELFFGSASTLERHFRAITDRLGPGTRAVVLRVKRVRSPDAVGLSLLEQFESQMRAAGVRVVLCGVRADLHEAMRRTAFLDRLDHDQLHLEPARAEDAVRAAYAWLGEDPPLPAG